jgi:hypothetical protein
MAFGVYGIAMDLELWVRMVTDTKVLFEDSLHKAERPERKPPYQKFEISMKKSRPEEKPPWSTHYGQL